MTDENHYGFLETTAGSSTCLMWGSFTSDALPDATLNRTGVSSHTSDLKFNANRVNHYPVKP